MKISGPESLSGLCHTAIVLVLAIFSYCLLRWVASSVQMQLPNIQSPVLRIEKFHAVRMSMTGLREYVVEAPLLRQLPGKLGTKIEQPILDWYQQDGKLRKWRFQAEKGWIAAGQKTIRLEGAVVMYGTVDSGNSPIEVNTHDVLINLGDRYAETTALSKALTLGSDLRAIGIRAYLDSEKLELLSEVSVHYEPYKN
jgi:lipopolysaccharide export system protein LptC